MRKRLIGKHVASLLYIHTLPKHPRTETDFLDTVQVLYLGAIWNPPGQYSLLYLQPPKLPFLWVQQTLLMVFKRVGRAPYTPIVIMSIWDENCEGDAQCWG